VIRAIAWFLVAVVAFVAMTRIHVIVDTIQMWNIRRQQRRNRQSSS
jgi:hypothetical protein